VVRERIAAGDSDRQVLDYMHARYGDFILLRPPFQLPPGCCGWPRRSSFCWRPGSPSARGRRRTRNSVEPALLTPSEKAQLEALK